MTPKIAIIYHSMHGHVARLALAEKAGIEEAGGSVDVFQIQEILPPEILEKMHVPPQDSSIPFITPDKMKEYDGFLFGIPAHFGNYGVQWKSFIDQLGGLWMSGALYRKYFGLFIGTAGLGGGQESAALASLSTWVHQGMLFVPLGYATTLEQHSRMDEARGGSPWGAGTLSTSDGSRLPSITELEMATTQGKAFYETVSRVNF